MAMELSRQEYPALLASLQPEQAITVLADRVDLITKINTDIADWLHERRKIEEAYAAGLRKLSRRPQQDNASALGIFQMPWQRIISGTENLAQSHETLAAKIENDVETPLRQFASKNREMQSLSTTQGNITSIAREFSSAQKKFEKDHGKSREAASRARLDETSQLWESQAPFVFEQLQALDETRVNHLRDVLTQFQTHEVDQVERSRISAESCLNALLSMETADEIKTFAARVAGGRVSLARRPSSAAASSLGRPQSSGIGPPPTPPPRGHDRNIKQRLDGGQDQLTPLPEKHKSSLGGLKRLGTVIGRRKSTAQSPPPSSSEKRKEKGRSFAPFRRGESSRSFQDLEETGRDLTPVTSSQTQASHFRLSSHEPVSNVLTNESLPMVNGTDPQRIPEASLTATPLQPNNPFPTPASPYRAPPPQELSAAPSSPEYSSPPSDPVSRAQEDAGTTAPEPEESARNLLIRDQPIPEDETKAKQALNDMANQLRMQAQTSGVNRVQGSVRGRRDVRNTMFMPSPPAVETMDGAGISATPSATGLAPTVVAGAAATASAAGISMNELASPIKRSGTTNTLLGDGHPAMASDTNSVHSSHSLVGVIQHPELTQPGLNVSIVETVNTWFAESGSVTRSFVIGEVAMSYIATTDTEAENITEETIRLENFQVLEKVAANPTFVTAAGNGKQREERAGEYLVDTKVIRRPSPTVALKYQLHIESENTSAYSPLVLTPAWQIQEGQVSVIVVYALNPAFQIPAGGGGEVVLRNVVVSVGLDASGEGRAASAMMKPNEGAIFRKRQGAVVWRLGEVKLGPELESQEEKKLLVRFLTQGGLAKRGGVDVKFEVAAGSLLGVQRLKAPVPVVERDPFADGGEAEEEGASGAKEREWEGVPTQRKLVSGKYSAA